MSIFTKNIPIILLPGLCCDARIYSHQILTLYNSYHKHSPQHSSSHSTNHSNQLLSEFDHYYHQQHHHHTHSNNQHKLVFPFNHNTLKSFYAPNYSNIIFPIEQIINHTNISVIASNIIQHAPPEFVLCGFSMGGYIALEIMRQLYNRKHNIDEQIPDQYHSSKHTNHDQHHHHRPVGTRPLQQKLNVEPPKVHKLILIDSQLRADSEQSTIRRKGLIEKIHDLDSFKEVIKSQYPLFYSPQNATNTSFCNLVNDMCVHNGIEAFKNQQIAVMHRLDQTKTVKEKIDCPTLIMCGSSDAITPVASARELYNTLFSSSLQQQYHQLNQAPSSPQLSIISNAGHFSTIENPYECTNKLMKFLEQQY